MADHNDPHRVATWQNNLKASITFAESLVNQIPRSIGDRPKIASDLALAVRALLLEELSILENRDEQRDEHFKILMEVACARLGYRLLPETFCVKYYHMEVTTARNTFMKVISCPSVVPPETYTALLFASREEYRSCQVIAELSSSEAERIMREGFEQRIEKKKRAFIDRATEDAINATTEEIEIVEIAEKSGVLEAYGNVVRQRLLMLKQSTPPHNMGISFLSFLRSLVSLNLSPEIIDILAAEFGGAIEVYHAQGIAIVLSNGEIRWFCIVPQLKSHHKKQGSASLKINGRTVIRGRPTTDPVMRTRQGYVPANAHIFLQALLHYGRGDPRREMLPISIQSDTK